LLHKLGLESCAAAMTKGCCVGDALLECQSDRAFDPRFADLLRRMNLQP
jgi:hypothetical protein